MFVKLLVILLSLSRDLICDLFAESELKIYALASLVGVVTGRGLLIEGWFEAKFDWMFLLGVRSLTSIVSLASIVKPLTSIF